MTQSIVATLATGGAIEDLRVLLASLQIFNATPPTVYMFCDKRVADVLHTFKYPGRVIFREDLNRYSPFTRAAMEALPGRTFKSMWHEFMTEKINLLRWVFDKEQTGVFFCDADICFLDALPPVPEGALVALSPHQIRPGDEAKYGKYNGGFLWMKEARHAETWWAACAGARFYEQSALEDVAASLTGPELFEFPVTQNYGWWRMWQGVRIPEELQAEWSIHRGKGGAGIMVGGTTLGSVHTHFVTKDPATQAFNEWVISWLRRLGSHVPAKRILGAVQ